MTRISAPLFAALLVSLCGPAMARDCAPQLRDAWIRLTPGGMPMHAGFGRIENPCPSAATIVAASSPAYGSVELHETRVVEGISRMRAVPELRIAADGAATLKPGGLHLMLMQPRAPLKEGSKVAVEFTLSDGRKILGEFQVRNPAAL
jgi:copper(I)-binding protein